MRADDQSDRRRALRVEVERVVQLRYGGDGSACTGVAHNISQSGVKVAGVRLATVGERLRLRLLFAPREPITVSCAVTWSHSSTTDPTRGEMGLAFEDLTGETFKRLGRLVDQIHRDPSAPFTSVDPFAESGTWAPDGMTPVEVTALSVGGPHPPRERPDVEPPRQQPPLTPQRPLSETLALVFGGLLLLATGMIIYLILSRPSG